MRILHVLDHSLPLQSGYTFRTLKLIECQRAQGFETEHVTGPKQGFCEQATEFFQGLTFKRSPPLRGIKSWPLLRQIFTILHLKRVIKETLALSKFDVIHVHSPVLNGLAAYSVAKKFGIPVVYEIRAFWEDAGVDHGTHKANSLRYKLSRSLESFLLKKVHHVTTICQGLKNELIERGLKRDKITVIANAVDHKFFNSQQVNASLRAKLQKQYKLNDKYVFGYIGSFYAYEGLSSLLVAISQLQSQLGRFSVLLVGGGPEEAALREQIETLKLGDLVHIISRVAQEDVPTYYACCDLCVYPRKKMRLTDLVTPLKPLEAMAQGIPVLASDVGGHCELIKSEQTGFLFEADNLQSLKNSLLQRRYQNRPVDVIFKAQNYVVEEKNWQTTTKPYEQIFKKSCEA